MVYRNTRTLKTPNFYHKLLILWLITGGLEYFFMDRKYVRMFLSLERTFWRTFFKKIFFLGVHLLAHSGLFMYWFVTYAKKTLRLTSTLIPAARVNVK